MKIRWNSTGSLVVFLALWAATPAFAALPAPWTEHQVGTGDSGSAAHSGGTFTVTGKGDVWGTSDSLYFVYQNYTGDFEFVAKLATLSFLLYQNDPIAGIMLREGTGAGSRNIFMFQYSRCDGPSIPGQHVRSHGRIWSGERSIWGTQAPILAHGETSCPNPVPYQWLKLIRYKDQVTLYASPDGSAWRHVEGWTLDGLASAVEIGFAAVSGNQTTTATATFTNVSIKPLSLPLKTTWFGNSLPGGTAAVPHNVLSMHVNSANDRIHLSNYWDEAGAEGSIFTQAGTFYGRLDAIHGLHSGYAVTSTSAYVYIGVRVPGVDPTNPDPVTGCDDDSGRPHKPNVRYGIRRYNLDGTPAPFETCTAYCNCTNGYDGSIRSMVEVDETVDRHIRGLAWGNSTLYVSDTNANIVRKYDANLTAQGDFPASPAITSPKDLAVASDGSLWIAGGIGELKKVFHYTSSGTKQSQELYGGEEWDPSAVAIDSSGLIWVTDAGPDMNIKKFNPGNGTSAGTFGAAGGIASGNRGEVADLKFNPPVGVGFDSSGNIYVAADGGADDRNSGGTEIRKFNPTGSQMLWARYGLEFVDAGDADPATNGNDIYTMEGHYSMDYTQPAGQEWSYKGFTYDRTSGYDDIRGHLFNNGGAGGTYLRRGSDGKRYLFTTSTHGTFLGVFRFASDTSEAAIPATLFASAHQLEDETAIPPVAESPSWPTNQPQGQGGKPWIWVDDESGVPDGMIQGGTEYEEFGVNETVRQWWVDSAMHVWAAVIHNASVAIRRYVLQSITNGVPVYTGSGTVSFAPSTLNEWTAANCTSGQATDLAVTQVRRLLFDAATKDMYVTVFTTALPDFDPNVDPPNPPNDPNYRPHDWQAGGRELRKYSNWDGNGSGPVRKLQWRAVLPWGGALLPAKGKYHNVTSISFAGSRVFANIMDTGEVLAYEAANGGNACISTRSALTKMVPGHEIAGKTGWFDVPTSMNALQRSNGDYIVIAEEDLQAKGLVYRDTPLYVETLESATPFTLINPVSGGSAPTYPTIDGSKVVKFRDTSSGINAAIYQNTLTSSHPLVARINQVYAQPAGSSAVVFDLSFTAERAEASSAPVSASINAGILLNKVGGGTLNPTGVPSIFGSPAYTSNEAAGSEKLELVNRDWSSSLRFSITPDGGATVINTLNFQFQVRVGGGATPESYYIDNLTALEVVP